MFTSLEVTNGSYRNYVILVLLTSSIKMLWQYSCISTNYSQHFQFLFVLYMYIYMYMYVFVYFMNYRNLNGISPLGTSTCIVLTIMYDTYMCI